MKLFAWWKEHHDEFFTDVVVAPSAPNHWIQGAIKHPGALRAKAQAAGAMTKHDTIRVSWLRDMAAHGDTTTRRQASLALRLRGFGH